MVVKHYLYNICYLEVELKQELIVIICKYEQELTSSVVVKQWGERLMWLCLTQIYHLTQPFSTCFHQVAKLSVPAWLAVMCLSQCGIKAQDWIKHLNLCIIDSEKKMRYSDSKNPFHTNPKCGVRSALPYSVGIPLSFGGVIQYIPLATIFLPGSCDLSHRV